MLIPITGRWSRLIALAYGIALFVWLSLEDTTTGPVLLFGLCLSLLIVLLTTFDKLGGQRVALRYILPLFAGMGILSGLGTGIAVAGLMFFKNARHAHLFPDYPPQMMIAVLERGPVWGLAGGLIGVSMALAWLALRGETAAK